MSIIVTTQKELDAALKQPGYVKIDIRSPREAWLDVTATTDEQTVRAYGSSTVTAYDSSTVTAYDSSTVTASGSSTVTASGSSTVRAYDSSTVTAYDSSTVTAYDSSTVRAYGSSTVTASGSSTVRAYDSSTVTAYDSSTVTAYDSSTVRAYGSSTVTASGSSTVRASKYTAVHLTSANATVNSAGAVIDTSTVDRSDWATYVDYYGIEIEDGRAIFYKAVDKDLKSQRDFAYPIGETVTCPDWREGDFCGNGLHLSPRPVHAWHYFSGATRFLRCSVPLDGVSIIAGNSTSTPKIKAREVTILSEVDIDGNPLKG